MAIQVSLTDENRVILAMVASPASLTDWLLSVADLPPTVCLRFVDRFGDTVFNSSQMRVLTDEIEAVSGTLTEELVNSAHASWLGTFDGSGPVVQGYARRYSKPTVADLRRHAAGIQELAAEGLRRTHVYLWFIGD